MRKVSWIVLVSILSVLFLFSCAPAAAPSTSPLPATRTVAAPATPAPGSAASPVDPEWQKVIEAAKKEGKLTVYSFSFVGDLGIALSKAFKERYGIQMELVAGSGAVFLERIKVESRAGQRVADVLEGSATNGILAKKDGLTQSLGNLPSAAEKGVWLFDPRIDTENNLIGYSPSISTTWANTQLVKPADEPKSWRDLLDPKWKGKIVVTEPDNMPLPTVYYIAFTRYMSLDDDYFRAIGKQDLVIATNQRENDSKLIRGEVPLSFTSNLTSMSMLVAEGAPAKPLDMKEGVPGRVQTLNIVKDAAHPNAAKVFINWLLSAEGQTIGARLRSTLPLRTDVQDFTPTQARIKYTKVFPLSPKDEDDNTKALRDRVVSKLWGR